MLKQQDSPGVAGFNNLSQGFYVILLLHALHKLPSPSPNTKSGSLKRTNWFSAYSSYSMNSSFCLI